MDLRMESPGPSSQAFQVTIDQGGSCIPPTKTNKQTKTKEKPKPQLFSQLETKVKDKYYCERART